MVGRALGHLLLSRNETNGIVQPDKRQTVLGRESMKLESKTSANVLRNSVSLHHLVLSHTDETQTIATSPIATEYRSKSTIATIDLVEADLHPENYSPRSKATDTTAAKASTHFRDCKCYQSQRETSTTPTTPATPPAHTAPTIHADLNLAVPEQNRTCILPLRKGKSMKYPYQVASMAIQQALTALKYIRVLDTPQGGTNLTIEQHK